MSTQPEQVLEDNLVAQLVRLGYRYVALRDEAAMLRNLRAQLGAHNGVQLSDREFARVLAHLGTGSVFERAKVLRDKLHLTRDNGESCYLEFLNLEHWCQNEYQVTRQVSQEGSFRNRYDVTLLVNGLPLAQIELKRRGVELKEAFNQVNRYQRHSFAASHGLYLFTQLFVISNGVNTKYYANNRGQSFKQTFYWSDKDNKTIRALDAFADAFLEPCHLSKMLTRYTVLNETEKALMVLRPYQYYAAEALVERVRSGTRNGYIWHTTGSGKTLTSFKASQILMGLPQVHKVVFVVDRKDLDYQTAREFNAFAKSSIDGTTDTSALVRQLADPATRLIVTTIQKLNTALARPAHLTRLDGLREQRIVFIFDECHRSQFGATHQRIRAFFGGSQLFGFTGTPIFADNAVSNELGKRTTRELFDECLHKYVITDAIRDENVLKFSVEYVGRYRQKDGSATALDIEVEALDTQELLESDDRLNKITDYLLAHHDRKTHSREFTAMFCVASVPLLIKYYELLRRKKQEGRHSLRAATIFSYGTNENDLDANGHAVLEDDVLLAAEAPATYHAHSRDKLEEFIGDYNEQFGTRYTTRDSQSFYNYYNELSRRVKNREVDVLLVVNMFLTGFDSKPLNTLYVDKNLRYHGLIQAFSRTNRMLNEQKSQGNIVCFRNLKQATDEAIALFSDKEARDIILMKPFEEYVRLFDEAYARLLTITPTVEAVDELPSEVEELEFVRAFRELLRLRNVLATFADFRFEVLQMPAQEFEDFKSKYLDLHDKVKSSTFREKVSILDDVDFELELLHRDDINVAYILTLLAKLRQARPADQARQRRAIQELLTGETTLRSKRELIEKFITENLPQLADAADVAPEFDAFWDGERRRAFDQLAEEEGLDPVLLDEAISSYLFSNHRPLPDEVVAMLQVKPKILARRPVVERVTARILDFVETFINGMG